MKKIKQDINFLDKPLWFQNSGSAKDTVWTDIDNYVYRAGYKLPDKIDMIFLFYMLLECQKANYKHKMVFTRYQILKECDFQPTVASYLRLAESLERWLNVAITFDGTFYDGKEYIKIGFHIIENYEINKETNRLEVHFNPLWLLKIKESKFFKYINFDYYRALKRPLSRRLFEILCKTFKGRESWEIDLVKLGTKLTLSKRKVYPLRGDVKEVMYHSDVLVALKPAINEINKLAENKALFEALGIPKSEAFAIDYQLRNENTIIRFSKRIPNWVKQEMAQEMGIEAQVELTPSITEDPSLKQLLALCKNQTKTLKEAISKVYQEKGFEYVKWNILYTNQESRKNYVVFLKKALKANWGAEFMELEEQKTNIEKAVQEEKNSSLREGLKKDAEIEKLDTLYYALPEETQKTLWDSAVQDYYNNGVPLSFKMPKRMVLAKIHEWLKNQAFSGKK